MAIRPFPGARVRSVSQIERFVAAGLQGIELEDRAFCCQYWPNGQGIIACLKGQHYRPLHAAVVSFSAINEASFPEG
jgi:hypothetical protein